jgi:microcystin degradation protein MlrC
VSAEVIFKGEGRFFARGGTYTGQEFSMGRVVVLAAGQIRIVVSTRGALAADPAFYESVGLEPNTALAVHVKSPMGWRAGYSASEEQGLIFDGPGVASLNFLRVPFTGVGRNLFPVANPPAAAITVWQTPGPSEPVV